MSRIFTNILGAIGKTPLVQINNIAKDIDARILVKIESMNPLSSVKDRAALALIESAEKEGKIAPLLKYLSTFDFSGLELSPGYLIQSTKSFLPSKYCATFKALSQCLCIRRCNVSKPCKNKNALN
ncbi:cysteine synthase, partial [Candidatus Magnetomorum sp. HK-1]